MPLASHASSSNNKKKKKKKTQSTTGGSNQTSSQSPRDMHAAPAADISNSTPVTSPAATITTTTSTGGGCGGLHDLQGAQKQQQQQLFPYLTAAAAAALAVASSSSSVPSSPCCEMGPRQDSISSSNGGQYAAAAISFDCARIDPATSSASCSPVFPRLRRQQQQQQQRVLLQHGKPTQAAAKKDGQSSCEHEPWLREKQSPSQESVRCGAVSDDNNIRDGSAGGIVGDGESDGEDEGACGDTEADVLAPKRLVVVVVAPLDASNVVSDSATGSSAPTPCCGCAPLLTPSVAAAPPTSIISAPKSLAEAAAAATAAAATGALVPSDSDSNCSATSFGVDFVGRDDSAARNLGANGKQGNSNSNSNNHNHIFDAFRQDHQQPPMSQQLQLQSHFIVDGGRNSNSASGAVTPVTVTAATAASSVGRGLFPPPPPPSYFETTCANPMPSTVLPSCDHHLSPSSAAAPADVNSSSLHLPCSVGYHQVNACVQAQIVDQFTLENIHTAPASASGYHSEHQRGGIVLATARTLSGRVFTVQRLMVGQLDRGFLAQLGCHALGKLLSFVCGEQLLLFGYPMVCPKRPQSQAAPSAAAAAASAAAASASSPEMLGIWLAIDGVGIGLADLQRMRVLFADNSTMLCALDAGQQAELLDEAERRRQQHHVHSSLNQQQQQMMMTMNTMTIGSAGLSSPTLLGMPESPLTLEPARSPPGGSEKILSTLQMPVVLYTPPAVHPLFGAMPPRGFRPFVDTTHRRDNANNNNSGSGHIHKPAHNMGRNNSNNNGLHQYHAHQHHHHHHVPQFQSHFAPPPPPPSFFAAFAGLNNINNHGPHRHTVMMTMAQAQQAWVAEW